MANNSFEKLIEFLFYLFLIWLAIQIVLKLSGNSPSTDSILVTGLGLVISYLLIATNKVSHFMGETSQFIKNSENAFSRIREDIDKIKKKLKIY